MAQFTSHSPTKRRAVLDALLATLATRPAGALLTTPTAHLFKTSLVFNQDTPIATFHTAEADFSGYAAQALPAAVGPISPGGQTDALLYTVNFLANGIPATPQNNVYGYWVDHNAGADWVLAELFPEPIPFTQTGDYLDLSVLFALAWVELTGD